MGGLSKYIYVCERAIGKDSQHVLKELMCFSNYHILIIQRKRVSMCRKYLFSCAFIIRVASLRISGAKINGEYKILFVTDSFIKCC